VVSRVGFHLGARSCDVMYRMRESESKLELFHRLFLEFFCHPFLALGLNTCLNGVWNYFYLYQSDLTPFKRRSDFRVICERANGATSTDVWQAMVARAIESQENSSEPPVDGV